ncbi:1356_t:CDS:1, partial [Ambispora gerdemannii]
VVRLSLTQLDLVYFPKRWQKDPPELELAKDYVNFYSHSQSQAPETPTSYESSSKSISQLRYMRIHRLSGEIASKIATDPDKCVDFMSYLEKYLEALYVDDAVSTSYENASASSKHPIINNPIKCKAVG